MKNASIIALSVLSFLVVSCNLVEDKEFAQSRIERLLDSRITSNTMIPDTEYSPEFKKSTTTDDWENIKKLVLKANGNLKSYNLKTWNTNKSANIGKLSGTFVTFQYETEYEKGTGVETIVIHKSKKQDPFKILSHYFNSKEIQNLQKEGLKKAVEN